MIGIFIGVDGLSGNVNEPNMLLKIFPLRCQVLGTHYLLLFHYEARNSAHGLLQCTYFA